MSHLCFSEPHVYEDVSKGNLCQAAILPSGSIADVAHPLQIRGIMIGRSTKDVIFIHFLWQLYQGQNFCVLKVSAMCADEKKPSMLQALTSDVLTSPYVWLFAISYFFVYVVRQGTTSWFIFYLKVISSSYFKIRFDISGTIVKPASHSAPLYTPQ